MCRRVNPGRIADVFPGIEVRVIAGAEPHSRVQ
jgi:hypothetical protein